LQEERMNLLRILAVASTLLASTAQGADGWVILHTGIQEGKAASHARGAMIDLGFTRSQANRARSLAEYAFDDAELWTREAPARICPAGKRTLSLQTMIQTAEQAIAGWEYEAADQALSPLLDDLECLGEPLDGPTLAKAALLLGYARFESGDEAGARVAFEIAAGFHPVVEWDERFPPDAGRIFEESVEAALYAEESRLQVLDAYRVHPEIRIDGGPFPGDGAVTPGLHRITVRRGEDEEITLAVQLEPGQTASLVPVADLIGAFLDGDAASESAAEALAAALDWTGAAEAYIGAPLLDRVYRFRADSRVLHEVPGPPEGGEVAVVTQPSPPSSPAPTVHPAVAPIKRQQVAGAIVLGVGAATTAAGLITHGTAYNSGLEATDRVRYEWARDTNVAGFAVGMVGIGVAVTGLVLLVDAGVRGSRVAVSPGPVTAVSLRF